MIWLPGGGQHAVDSASLRLFSEGVIGQLPDRRRFFARTSGLLVVDLPRTGDDPEPEPTP